MHFAGTQLLVVSTLYRAGANGCAARTEELPGRLYRSEQRVGACFKVLIADLGANGLFARREENQFDTADLAGKSYSFDGDWGRAKISEQDYKAFQERY